MEIDEAIEEFKQLKYEMENKYPDELKYFDKAIEALKFQQEYQSEMTKLYNQMMDNEKDYQRALEEKNFVIDSLNKVISLNVERVQKCIERIDGYIEATYYNSVSGSISDGNKNAAYHNCKNIIKEEMGVVE